MVSYIGNNWNKVFPESHEDVFIKYEDSIRIRMTFFSVVFKNIFIYIGFSRLLMENKVT